MRAAGWMKAIVAGALCGLLLLGGCSPEQGGTKVRLSEVARTIFYAPQYVALSQGFFAEEGLDVELTTIPGGDKSMTALLSNQTDMALIGAETSIYVAQQEAKDPVINFAQLTQTDGTLLFSRNIKGSFDWKDMKGNTFLGQRKGGMPQMAGEFALRKHNIDPHHDMKLIQNIDFANIPSAFASGTGDYVQLFEPQASIFEKEGRGRVVASFGTESGLLPYTVYMAKQSYMQQNGETVQKFTNALQRAQRWVKVHPPEQIAAAILPYFKDTDKDIVISSVKRYKEQGTYAESPVIDSKEWGNLLNVMSSAGELQRKVSLKEIVNDQYAEKAASFK